MKAKVAGVLLVAVLAVSAASLALTPSKYRKIDTDSHTGNCIFTTNEPELGKEDSYNVQSEFRCGKIDNIYARCYFPKTVDAYKPTRWSAYFQMGLHDRETLIDAKVMKGWDSERFDLVMKGGGCHNDKLDFGGVVACAIGNFCETNNVGSAEGNIYVRGMFKEGEHQVYGVTKDINDNVKVTQHAEEDSSYLPVAGGKFTIIAGGGKGVSIDKKGDSMKGLKKIFGN